MKNIPMFCILLFSISILAQNPIEKVVVVKGCEKFTENKKLADCMYKTLTSSLRKQRFINTLSKNLNPGQNKLRVYYIITAEKEVKFTTINTTNLKVAKLIQKQIEKVKIIEPGTQKGKAIDVKYSLPLTLKVNTLGSVPIHKMSRLIYFYDESNTKNLRPALEHCPNTDKKESIAKCMNTYMVDGTFNSVDSSKINSMLKDGINTFQIKITYNENNEIIKVKSASGNSKLDTVFETSVEELLKRGNFKSPNDETTSYPGEMLMTLNYLKT